jgi:hypothetical protein
MFKFPLSIPPGREVEVTQGFKSTSLVDFYRSKGIFISEHDAVDVRLRGGMARDTYGLPFVSPFPSASLLPTNYIESDPIHGQSGRVLIEYIENGISYVMGGIHLSGTVKQDVYKEGDILGYVGNYGAVLPEPTIGTPFGGSHLHLTLVIKKPGELNGTVVDPLLYFDVNNPYRSPDTGIARDVPAIQWAIAQIKIAMRKLGLSA